MLPEPNQHAEEVRVLVTALRDTYADLTQMVPGVTKPYVEKILDSYKGIEDPTVVGRMAHRRLYGDPTTFGGNVQQIDGTGAAE